MLEVLLHGIMNPLRRAERSVRCSHVDTSVGLGDFVGQTVDVCSRDSSLLQQMAENCLLRELIHLDGELDRCAGSIHKRMTGTAGDGHDVEIQRRRQPTIQLQFLPAEKTPLPEHRKIDEAEIGRFLDFVGVLFGQKNHEM